MNPPDPSWFQAVVVAVLVCAVIGATAGYVGLRVAVKDLRQVEGRPRATITGRGWVRIWSVAVVGQSLIGIAAAARLIHEDPLSEGTVTMGLPLLLLSGVGTWLALSLLNDRRKIIELKRIELGHDHSPVHRKRLRHLRSA